MDDVDDERFARGPLLPPVPARHAGGPPLLGQDVAEVRVTGAREEQLVGPRGRPHALRVRGREPHERERLRDEAQLLAALEVAGLAAAPDVLEIEDEGYVRETAPAVSRHEGRRAAPAPAPPTAERLAVARAREALDALIDALHTRGWVLGAEHGQGLGRRPDGTVVVLDLRGLRRDERLGSRREDRRWVDSVLEDHDRTLRRRIAPGPPVAELAVPPPDVPAPPERSEGPAGAGGAGGVTGPDAWDPRTAATDADPLPAPRRLRRRVDAGAPLDGSAPEPARARRTRSAWLAALPGRAVSETAEVLRRPRLRRTALLSAVTALLCGGLLALGAWWIGRDAEPHRAPAPPAAAGVEEDPPAPEIEDPWELAAELAGTRHAYVTGLSELPASAPGSPALAEDERVREAYAHLTVRGGGPVVHEAELLGLSPAEGTATLRVVTSVQEHELVAADGGSTTVPGSTPVTVVLALRWDGGTWQILDVEEETGTS